GGTPDYIDDGEGEDESQALAGFAGHGLMYRDTRDGMGYVTRQRGPAPQGNPMKQASPMSVKEITLRGILIGIALTVLFTAANVYFGLKAGLTFSTSIPAVVISMALLRAMGQVSWQLGGTPTPQENNIVQTIASTAGTLSSIIFVLPGFIMIGWWTGFPYWESVAICTTGGILGVMYSIPLRRALVTESDLPYPEGTACAEVIKVGSGSAEGDQSVES